MDEKHLKHWLLEKLGSNVWTSFVEAGKGSTVGTADLLMQIEHTNRIVPVEFKMAVFKKGGTEKAWSNSEQAHVDKDVPARVRPKRIDAMQIGWHDRANRAGIPTRFVFGVYLPSLDVHWNVQR